MIVFCDIDGVLADCGHRLHYKEEKDYDKFYGLEMLDDRTINAGLELLALVEEKDEDVPIILISGRPERTRKATTVWLDVCGLVYYDEILMRKDGDYRSSDIVKKELIEKYLMHNPQYKNWMAYFIDDDPKNVKAIEATFPNFTGLVFSTKRLGGKDEL